MKKRELYFHCRASVETLEKLEVILLRMPQIRSGKKLVSRGDFLEVAVNRFYSELK